MSDFRARLFEERTQLMQRVEKLKAFICSDKFEELDQIDQGDLREQLSHMQCYLDVIHRRASRLCNNA